MFASSDPRLQRVRTTFSSLPAKPPTDALREEAAEARRLQLCPSRHLTVDHLIRLYDRIALEGGTATIYEICHALPDVARPVAGILDLCDAGLLHGDFDAPFDGDTRIWRLDR